MDRTKLVRTLGTPLRKTFSDKLVGKVGAERNYLSSHNSILTRKDLRPGTKQFSGAFNELNKDAVQRVCAQWLSVKYCNKVMKVHNQPPPRHPSAVLCVYPSSAGIKPIFHGQEREREGPGSLTETICLPSSSHSRQGPVNVFVLIIIRYY